MIRVAIADPAITRALRLAVLRADAADPASLPAPGDAEDAIHIAALDDGNVVGAAALLPRAFPLKPTVTNVLQLRGMAVAPTHRSTGVGTLVFAGALGIATSRGDELLWCNARTSARPFYERLGLRAEGDEFVSAESGVPHYLMWRPVAGEFR